MKIGSTKKKRFEKNDFIHLKEEAIMTITHIFTLFFNYFRSYFLPQKMIMLIFLNLHILFFKSESETYRNLGGCSFCIKRERERRRRKRQSFKALINDRLKHSNHIISLEKGFLSAQLKGP